MHRDFTFSAKRVKQTKVSQVGRKELHIFKRSFKLGYRKFALYTL